MKKLFCDICGEELSGIENNMEDGKLIINVNNNKIDPNIEIRLYMVDENAGPTTFSTYSYDICSSCLRKLI